MIDVVVGIPTMNGPERLARALDSVLAHSEVPGVSVRALVSDDSSAPEHLEANRALVRRLSIDMLETERNLGVPGQWNRLVRHHDCRYGVLINDDIEVVPDWLDVLVYTLQQNRLVGMVGLRAEVGVTRATAVSRPFVDYHEAALMHANGALLASGGSCFAFRREDFDAVGGFDERYQFFYEEVDFGVSLAKRGLFNVIASYPLVYHLGSATITPNFEAQRILLESREKFAVKWGTSLDMLRAEFGCRGRPAFREWNTALKTCRHP